MTSAINPNNINGAYPVAGQDNNSQGFRDNFTNTKTNFQYAADEISDLQSKVVLKAALTGTTLNNNMLGSIVSNGVAQNFGLTRVALGSQSGSVTINYTAGHYQTLTLVGNTSLLFSNVPPSGVTGVITVQVTVGAPAPYTTPYTLTLPTQVSVNNAGIQGAEVSASGTTITFAPSGTDTTYAFQFITSDGGSSYTVNQVNAAMQPFNNSSEDLAASAAASLIKTTSYFTTGALGETATLAAGVAGQIKTLIMNNTAGGSMTITVAQAGWKSPGSSGTVTFTTRGQACTLQFTAGYWFCIGNNGAVFA
jgi:hypothetical protein